jgi:hypothetical protein
MTDTITEKPGLLGLADDPDTTTTKLAAAIGADTASNASALGEMFTQTTTTAGLEAVSAVVPV